MKNWGQVTAVRSLSRTSLATSKSYDVNQTVSTVLQALHTLQGYEARWWNNDNAAIHWNPDGTIENKVNIYNATSLCNGVNYLYTPEVTRPFC